jgi:hypothetical protein
MRKNQPVTGAVTPMRIRKVILCIASIVNTKSTHQSMKTIMNKPMRQGYETPELAIAGGIAQMKQAKLVGFAVSAQDAKLRHIAACEAMARSNAESRNMMTRLRNNIKPEPMTPEQMSEIYYPKRRSHNVNSGDGTR